MALYADANYPVAPAIEALHRDELDSYAHAGTWGSAAQRTAIAATARQARVASSAQASAGDEALTGLVDLPEPAQRLARAVAEGAVDIDRDFCARVQSEGITEGAYVEIVGLVSRLVNLDVFARGLGVAPRKLSKPKDDRAPTFKRPPEAVNEGFFTATVPSAPAGGALAESLYGKAPAGNILRTLSLVPDEARRLIALVGGQYYGMDEFLDFGHNAKHALNRAQIELVATKVSEHNRCFY